MFTFTYCMLAHLGHQNRWNNNCDSILHLPDFYIHSPDPVRWHDHMEDLKIEELTQKYPNFAFEVYQ